MGVKNVQIIVFIENNEYLRNFFMRCFFSESNDVVLLVPILSDQGAHEKNHEFHEDEYYVGLHHTLYIGSHIMDPWIHGGHHDQNDPKPSKK